MSQPNVDALKDKVIKEYNQLLCLVRKGHRPNYEFLLEEISFIDLIENNKINNSQIVLQFYNNNKWQKQ